MRSRARRAAGGAPRPHHQHHAIADAFKPLVLGVGAHRRRVNYDIAEARPHDARKVMPAAGLQQVARALPRAAGRQKVQLAIAFHAAATLLESVGAAEDSGQARFGVHAQNAVHRRTAQIAIQQQDRTAAQGQRAGQVHGGQGFSVAGGRARDQHDLRLPWVQRQPAADGAIGLEPGRGQMPARPHDFGPRCNAGDCHTVQIQRVRHRPDRVRTISRLAAAPAVARRSRMRRRS